MLVRSTADLQQLRYLLEFRRLQALFFFTSNHHSEPGDRYLFRCEDCAERNELEMLSSVFEGRGDLQAALRLACLNARLDTNRDTWAEKLGRVDYLSSQLRLSTDSSDIFRALWAQLYALDLLLDRDSTTNVELRMAECNSIMDFLRARGLECPHITMVLRLLKLQQMPPTFESIEEILLLAKEAHQDQNYCVERRCLLGADIALGEMSKTSPLDVQHRLPREQVRLRSLKLEEDVIQSVYYTAMVLSRFAVIALELRQQAEYIKYVSEFFDRTADTLDAPMI